MQPGQLAIGPRPADTVCLAPVAAAQWKTIGRSGIQPVQVYAVGRPELGRNRPVDLLEYET